MLGNENEADIFVLAVKGGLENFAQPCPYDLMETGNHTMLPDFELRPTSSCPDYQQASQLDLFSRFQTMIG